MIQLKNLTLKSRVIQSPMAGCTDLAFRLIARSHGMEMAYLEMVSSESLVRQNQKTFKLMKTMKQDRPVGCQIVGCRPEIMGEAARLVEEMESYDLIDINIGCPVPKITGPGGGSALLREPDTARKIFEAIMKNVKKLPVTVKMRVGYDDPSGEEAIRLAKIAQDEGLVAVSVHGRTRAQGYSGSANWETIGKIKKAIQIPLFGNGDVNSGEDAKRLMEISGCDGVMLGRGALGNPWIYKSVHAAISNEPADGRPGLAERKRTFLRHLELEIELEGDRIGLLKCRKIASWYFKGYEGAPGFRDQINRCETAEGMRKIVNDFEPVVGES